MKNNEPIRAVLVGCGGMSKKWLSVVQAMNDVEITALVDMDVSKAEERRDQYELNGILTTGKLIEAITHVNPDVVFDCTIPAAHYEITMEALGNGCHVLGEKPMSDSMDNAREMMRTAQANNRIYAVIKNRRYDDNIVRYRETLKKAPIGDITTVNADFFKGNLSPGFREEMRHVLLRDMAIHSFDQARFICGEEPLSVYCHEWTPKGSWFAHGPSAVAVFEMTGGVVFTYRGSWCAQGLPTPWQCEWRTIGTDGSATWDGENQIKCQHMKLSEENKKVARDFVAPDIPPLPHKWHAGVIREFVDCVRQGGTPQTDCRHNIKSFAMVEAAVESSGNGKKVLIDAT